MDSCMGSYNSYETVRKLPYLVVDKLIYNCPELWKLMKYVEPLGKPNLSVEEISKMICPNSMNVDNYNVVLQKFSQNAMADDSGNIFAQMRISVLQARSINNTVGRISLLFEMVVHNFKVVCDTDNGALQDRSMAMTQSIIECLNGATLSPYEPATSDNGVQLYINGMEDMSAGFKQISFNNEYSGYQLIINANILG